MRLHNPHHPILRRLHSVIMSAIRWASSALDSRATRGVESRVSAQGSRWLASWLRVLARRKPTLTCSSSARHAAFVHPLGLFAEQWKRRKPPTYFRKASETISRTEQYLSRKNMLWFKNNRRLSLSVAKFIVLIDENAIMRFRQILRIFHFA